MGKTAFTKTRDSLRTRRHFRVRKKVNGTAERPRLVIYRSLKHIYAQLVDDVAQRTLMTVTGLDYDAACTRLDEAGGSVKVAVVMTLANATADEARARIERAGGYVRGALEEGAKP